MIGFKGLIVKSALTNQSLQTIVAKTEEYRKIVHSLLNFYQEINKFEETRIQCNTKILSEVGTYNYQDQFNKSLWNLIYTVMAQQNTLSQRLKPSTEQSVDFSNKIFAGMSTQVSRLSNAIEAYQQSQQAAGEQGKKYFKIHKNMLTAIDQYKQSFSDVNLIYNMDQKNKRYDNCEQLYKQAISQKLITFQKCEEVTNKKTALKNVYNEMLQQFQAGIQKIAEHSINKVQQLMSNLSACSMKILDIVKKFEKHTVFNSDYKSDFRETGNQLKLQHFQQQQIINVNTVFPLFLEYHSLLKEESLCKFNGQITNYLQIINEKLRVKRQENKKLLQAIITYFRNLQKAITAGVKQILINFEKNRKKIAEFFGNRLVVFLKVMASIFEISVGVNERLLHSVTPTLQAIQNNISEISKLYKYFSEQINTNIQRFTVKRQLKLADSYKDFEDRSADIRLIRKQIAQKSQFIKHLITGFQQKNIKNVQKLMSSFQELISCLSHAASQFYSFCDEYCELYFGDKQISKNLQKFYQDFKATRSKNTEAYKQFALNGIKADESKVTFEGDFVKIQDFKKLKKPIKIETSSLHDSKIEGESSSFQQLKSSKSLNTTTLMKTESTPESVTDFQKQTKNAQFLMTKIVFKQNEKLVKTYSCALAQRIVLQGKIYITSQRVCFHSNFNSNNIFFGRTFIQFPKTDIKKIEKRKMSMMIDNSISFTTINGEIFFTSFFSRDQAYDLICKTFNFNLDDEVYEYEENQAQEIPEFLINYEEGDDMKIEQIEPRKQEIEKLIKPFAYIQASTTQIIQQGLNAIKIFRIFFDCNEVNINNKKFDNFLKYVKESIGHKDLEVSEWTPGLDVVLNKSNLKTSAPYSCSRKLCMMVPIGSSGVPFMPKSAKSEQFQVLYMFSKHKFMIDSTIQTFGVPYSDCFMVQMRIIVDSNEDGKCNIQYEYFVNFIKNTVMKSVIQSKTKQETQKVCKVWTSEIKRYFEVLHERSKKKLKSPEDIQSSELQNINRELDAQKEQNSKLKQRVQVLQKSQWTLKRVIIGSLVLNLIIFLIFVL